MKQLQELRIDLLKIKSSLEQYDSKHNLTPLFEQLNLACNRNEKWIAIHLLEKIIVHFKVILDGMDEYISLSSTIKNEQLENYLLLKDYLKKISK